MKIRLTKKRRVDKIPGIFGIIRFRTSLSWCIQSKTLGIRLWEERPALIPDRGRALAMIVILYIYIYIYIYIYTHTHTYTYIHASMHTYIHTHKRLPYYRPRGLEGEVAA
jgi:hypothetical protein